MYSQRSYFPERSDRRHYDASNHYQLTPPSKYTSSHTRGQYWKPYYDDRWQPRRRTNQRYNCYERSRSRSPSRYRDRMVPSYGTYFDIYTYIPLLKTHIAVTVAEEQYSAPAYEQPDTQAALRSPASHTSYNTTPPDPNRTMPKHFTQPLTCFYWAKHGGCMKSDAECWYAHYYTGVVAAAPVRLGDGTAVAGSRAQVCVDKISQDNDVFRARMEIINTKERSVDASRKEVRKVADQLQAQTKTVYDALSLLDEANIDAVHELRQCRAELSESMMTTMEDEPALGRALHIFDPSLDIVLAFKDRLSNIAHDLKNAVGVAEDPVQMELKPEEPSTTAGTQESMPELGKTDKVTAVKRLAASF